MPTLPLLSPAPHPDGWQRVAAPGGYESWLFEVDSDDRKTSFVAGLHLGWPMHARYVQRYAWYRAMPTRIVPPIPADFPVVTLELRQRGRTRVQVACEFDSSDFAAESDRLDVRIGGSRARTSDDGSIQLTARGQSGKLTIAATLTFVPRLRLAHRWEATEHHHVLLVDPLCDVQGQVQVYETGTQSPSIVPMSGLGYREHRFGLRSLSDASGVVALGRGIDDDSVTCVRVIDSVATAIHITGHGVVKRELRPEELRRNEPGWRIERIDTRKLAWLGVGRMLGPRVGV